MRFFSFLLVLLGAVSVTGCEEEVVAVLGTDQAFSLYGVLNPRADTQFVRVFPIESVLTPTTAEPLDVRLVSRDAETGQEVVWRDSVVAAVEGGYAHLFYAPFRAAYDRTYRLEITGADGRSSRATVDVPARTDLIVGDPSLTNPVIVTATLPGNVPRLLRSEAIFYVAYVTGYDPSGLPSYSFLEYPVPYDDHVTRRAEGYRIFFDLTEAYKHVRDRVVGRVDYVEGPGIFLAQVTFRTIVGNEAWQAPEGDFDPSLLMQPGMMSNVENGFGFVGGGYRLQHQWVPTDEVVARTGFRPCC